jgi:glycosyltransferase involved in cell wall biosynthesis
MKLTFSVIICTHNPRQDYLQRVLQALENQTLSKDQWELLLIDNASDTFLAKEVDLQWHHLARHIREEKLGLTHARLRGIEESIGDILIFVDDDNILELDFLEINTQINRDWSILGAWGGQIIPEFEQTPPEWVKPYLMFLALREFDRDIWSNATEMNKSVPFGAGLCVRKIVAQKYAAKVKEDNKRAILGRKGSLMTSCEDIDLALTACDLGWGTGQFKSLKLTHIISANRIQENYLLRLVKGTSYSGILMNAFRGKQLPTKPCFSQRIFQKYVRWRMKPRNRRFYDAKQAGINLALQEIASW